MKRHFLIFLFFISSVFGVLAQNREAQKIDEFENTNCDDYRARMDSLLTATDKLADSKGYVYIYSGKIQTYIRDKNTGNIKGERYVTPEEGRAKDIIGYFKNHLSFRGFTPNRIVFVEAGFREKFTIELWNIPNGAEPPKLSPTLQKIKQRKRKPKKFGFCGEM